MKTYSTKTGLKFERRYFRFKTPTNEKLLRVSSASSSPIYLKLSKTNVLNNSRKLSFIVDQEVQAKAYRAWIVGIFQALQQDHLTARITDRISKLLFKEPFPCYALKTASLAIQAKLDESMLPHIRNINIDDAVALLVAIQDICGGINKVSIASKKSEFQSLRIGENERATNFLTHAFKVIDNGNVYSIKISESEQIDNIIHGLAGNKAYDIERKGFIDRMIQEKYHPDRSYLSPVSLQEIVTKIGGKKYLKLLLQSYPSRPVTFSLKCSRRCRLRLDLCVKGDICSWCCLLSMFS
jgi:hypothetical protein